MCEYYGTLTLRSMTFNWLHDEIHLLSLFFLLTIFGKKVTVRTKITPKVFSILPPSLPLTAGYHVQRQSVSVPAHLIVWEHKTMNMDSKRTPPPSRFPN
jgi:hypothetical protein